MTTSRTSDLSLEDWCPKEIVPPAALYHCILWEDSSHIIFCFPNTQFLTIFQKEVIPSWALYRCILSLRLCSVIDFFFFFLFSFSLVVNIRMIRSLPKLESTVFNFFLENVFWFYHIHKGNFVIVHCSSLNEISIQRRHQQLFVRTIGRFSVQKLWQTYRIKEIQVFQVNFFVQMPLKLWCC